MLRWGHVLFKLLELSEILRRQSLDVPRFYYGTESIRNELNQRINESNELRTLRRILDCKDECEKILMA